MKLSYQIHKAFLLSKQPTPMNGFKSIELGSGRYLSVSYDYAPTIINRNENTGVLLGYTHDIRNPGKTEADIVKELLSVEGDERYELLDHLNGRYVIFLGTSEDLYVYSDASSFKPVFYSSVLEVISSHEYIIRAIMDDKGEHYEKYKMFRKGFMDFTPTEGVHKLSPSIELGYDAFEFKRIFPRKPRVDMEVQDILEEMDAYLAACIEWLKKQPKIKFSLTGGLDSRVSLAILKPIVDQVDFFTYLRPESELKTPTLEKSYRDDESIVSSIVYNMGLSHEFFSIGYEKDNKHYYDELRETVSSTHSYQLSKFLKDNRNYRDGLHLKSTIQSIGKSSFDTELYKSNSFDNAVTGISKWAPSEYKGKENRQALENLLSNYLDRIKIGETHGYHLLDLIFLESRLANFQSNITQETDNSVELYNFFNSRKMIELLLAPQLSERQTQKLAHSLIDKYWPVLNYFGINTKDNLDVAYSKLLKEVDETKQRHPSSPVDIRFETSGNIVVDEDSHGQFMMPKELPLVPEDEYKMCVINDSSNPVDVVFNSLYDKEQGRGRILVEMGDKDIDIVDLFRGVKVRIAAGGSMELKYSFMNEINKASWQRASKIYYKSENGAH